MSRMERPAKEKALVAIAAVALAFTYLAIGFALCAGFPQITRNLSAEHSAFDASPYAHDQLLDLALETRAFTVEGYARDVDGGSAADERYATVLIARAAGSAADPGKAHRWSDEARAILAEEDALQMKPWDAMLALSELDPSYALDADAMTHLNDVNEVISSARMPLLGITLIAAFCLMSLVTMFGPRAAGRALLLGGSAALALFAVLGAWGALGFDALFAWMHSLFFADGSWTFPADSLLIQMYPEAFWVGMGLWWLGSSCIVATASIIIGLVILRRRARTEEEPRRPAGLQA